MFNRIAPASKSQGRGLQSVGYTTLLINLFFWTGLLADSLRPVSTPVRAREQRAREANQLEPGKGIERELSGGGSHTYQITLVSSQYISLVVDQRGINVVLTIFAPDGKKIGEVDRNQVIEGSEAMSVIAETDGIYRVEVHAYEKTARTGRYEIKVAALRVATVEDKYRAAAESIFRDAERLQSGTVEGRRKSVGKYHEALELYRKAGDRGGESLILADMGLVYWALGEPQRALETFHKALPIWREVGDRGGEANTLNSMGLLYRSLGEMQKALETFHEALPIRREIGDRSGEAITLNNMGLVYRSLGEMQKALEKYNESLPIRRKVGDRKGEANTLNNIGVVYWLLGEPQRALEKLHEALPIRREVGDRNGEANTLNNIGLVYRFVDKLPEALEKYNESLLILRAVGDRNGEAGTLGNIGHLYLAMGRSQSALEKYNEALFISRAIGFRSGEAITLHNIGGAYETLGETRKALEKYNESLPIRREVSDRDGEAFTLLGIARMERKESNLTKARQAIERAIDIIESLRTNISGQELRAAYLASRHQCYESYIDILMQMHRQDPSAAFDGMALTVSERARARSLLELLTEARADIRYGVDRSLLERERDLQQRLNAKAAAQASLLGRKHTPAQAEAAAKELAAVATEYEELRARIRATSPKYAALTQPQPLSLAEIQQQVLDPETLLLEYSLGKDASYLFVVSQSSITGYQLPNREEIEAATRSVRELLTARQPQPGDTHASYGARIRKARADYWPQAAALSRMLLGPAASQLGTKRLLIVADGALQYLPFSALPTPDPGAAASPTAAESDTTPLIVDHEIVHLPSASALAVLRQELAGRQPAEKAVAVLADPVFTADDARLKSVRRDKAALAGREASSDLTRAIRSKESLAGREAPSDLTRAIDDVRGELRRLLMTRDEAEAILSVVPPKAGLKALDFRASRAMSTSDELSRYRIVHFATHGLLDSKHPELSGLVFSLVDEQRRPQDGFLRLHEIFNLRLPAELVVLSACQTGLGKEIKGEGLVGLTRGFMYAGAARVVASLWQVDDAATAELMKLFYRRMLQDGMRPAAALRAAQVEMWKRVQWRSPFYWGAFVLQGEWR